MKVIIPADLQVVKQPDINRLLIKQVQARLTMLRNPVARAMNARVQAYFNQRVKGRCVVLEWRSAATDP